MHAKELRISQRTVQAGLKLVLIFSLFFRKRGVFGSFRPVNQTAVIGHSAMGIEVHKCCVSAWERAQNLLENYRSKSFFLALVFPKGGENRPKIGCFPDFSSETLKPRKRVKRGPKRHIELPQRQPKLKTGWDP